MLVVWRVAPWTRHRALTWPRRTSAQCVGFFIPAPTMRPSRCCSYLPCGQYLPNGKKNGTTAADQLGNLQRHHQGRMARYHRGR
jgi:hypothetical protein